jgi:hypothetical protein
VDVAEDGYVSLNVTCNDKHTRSDRFCVPIVHWEESCPTVDEQGEAFCNCEGVPNECYVEDWSENGEFDETFSLTKPLSIVLPVDVGGQEPIELTVKGGPVLGEGTQE